MAYTPTKELRAEGAEASAGAGRAGGDRLRILFLGNSYNAFSVDCLRHLFALGDELGYEVVPGQHDPVGSGAWRLLRSRVKTLGWGPVLRKAQRLANSKTRMAARGAGIPLPGYASLPELCRARGCELISCSNPNGPEFVQRVKQLRIDLVVVACFGRILKRPMIEAPRIACVNVHPSLLPRYRGPEPFFWVLANGEKKTGVTIHYIDEGIDTGDIVAQCELEIRPGETERSLRKRSTQLAESLLREALPLLEAGTAPRIAQDHSRASYYSFPPRHNLPRAMRKARWQRAGLREAAERTYWLDPIEDARWPALVAEHPRASVFHTAAWLEALRRTYGYKPAVCTTTEPGAALRNGLVLCKVEKWLGGRRLVSLPFSDHCEPLADSKQELGALLRGLQAYCQEGAWRYAEIRPSSPAAEAESEAGFCPEAQYYLHTVDLRPAEKELLGRFHKSCIRYRIHRAEREGMRCERGRAELLLENFLRLHLLTRRRHGIPPQPAAWFRNLVSCMGDALEIWIAWHGRAAVAGMVVLRFRDVLVFKYGCSDEAYHKTGCVPFLLWRIMQAGKAEGCTLFDLGRSDRFDQGLIRFKDHLVSRRRLMTYWRYPGEPGKDLLEERPSLRMARQLGKRLPGPVLRTLGEVGYRYLA